MHTPRLTGEALLKTSQPAMGSRCCNGVGWNTVMSHAKHLAPHACCRFVFCHTDGIVVNPAMPVTTAVMNAITDRVSAGGLAAIKSHDYRAGVVVGESRRAAIVGAARDPGQIAHQGGWDSPAISNVRCAVLQASRKNEVCRHGCATH